MNKAEIINSLKSNVLFFAEDHHYELEGQRIKYTLTRLLKQLGIAPDYSFIPQDTLHKAAERGTMLHSILEIYDKFAELPPFMEEEYKDLVQDYISKKQDVLVSEFCVSYETLLATSIDKIILEDDKLIVADVKTTSKVHLESVKHQVSFGAYMLYKTTGLKADKGRLIWLNRKDNKCELEDFELVDFSVIEKVINDLQEVESLDALAPLDKVEQTLMVSQDIRNEIISLIEQEKEVKERLQTLKDFLTHLMRESGTKQAKFDGMQLTYILPTTIRTFDVSRFQKKHKDIDLTPYYKESKRKDSVRITLT